MKVSATDLPGVMVVEPTVFGDERGYFMETWNEARYQEAGIDASVVQTNLSRSSGGVLRGLHYQWRNPQGKLVSVVEGVIFDVAVDIRPGSSYFGQWVGRRLDDIDRCQLYVPPGFAHGFCALSDVVVVSYAATTAYDQGSDANIRWDDPAIAIDWPIEDPLISERDKSAPALADVTPDRLPQLPQ